MLGSSQYNRRRARAAAIAAAVALATGPAAAQSAACEDPAALRFSLAAKGKPAQQIRLYLPVLDLLAAETGKPVDIFIPGSDPSAVEALGGWAHLAALSVETYLEARAANPAVTPFAAPARPAGNLQTEAPGPEVVLISLKRSGIKKLKGAQGAVVGLADRESVLGYHVPRVVFTKQVGADLESYFSEVVYTGSHGDSAKAVMGGRVDVAFVAARKLDQMIDKQELLLEDINLLWRSPPLPAAPLVFDAGLCEALKQTIAETFLTLHTRFEVRQFLESFKSPRMLPVTDADYQIIRDLRAAPAEEPTE